MSLEMSLGACRVALYLRGHRAGCKSVDPMKPPEVRLLIAIAINAVLTRLLAGFAPIDVVAFVGTPVLFAGVGTTACYAPVRRAASIDPVVVLH